MIAKRWLLALVVMALAWGHVSAQSASDDAQVTAEATTAQSTAKVADEKCLNLKTDQRYVSIESVKAVSELPLYAAPLLELTVALKDLAQLPADRLCIKTSGYQLTRDESQPLHCELMIMGAQQNDAYTTAYRISATDTKLPIRLYAFCRTLNLPGSDGQNLVFPSSASVLNTALFDNPPDTDTTRFEDLAKIIQRATSNACMFSNNEPVTLNSLAVQFAVFILNESQDKRDVVWRSFLEKANNAFYRDERAAIYCLLEDTGIKPPEPTPLPTSGATPTPEPINTPTPPIPPVTDAVIPEGPFVDRKLGDVLLNLLLGTMFFAGVFLMVMLLWSIVRRRMRGTTLALLLVGLLVGGTLHAQDTTQNPHPPLMLMVLLDDSRTMDGASNNTATTTGNLDGGRNASDPQAVRYQALENLLAQLQADTFTAHQVAVLSYATSDRVTWLSGRDDTSRFITLGGGTDSAEFDALITAIDTRRDYPTGPGDTAKAFTQTALPILQRRLEAEDARQFRPVMLLITDDVPIARFADSPWNTEQAIGAWRASGLTEFENSLADLVPKAQYYSACRSSSGGLSLVTLSLGAANWVTGDGVLRTQAELETTPAPNTALEYFPALAQQLGSTWGDGAPMVYRIDPTFRSEQAVIDGFAKPVDELIPRLRCLWYSDTPTLDTTAPLNSVRYTFEVSDFYRQLWVMVRAPETAGVPQLTLSDGTPISATFKRSVGGYQALLLRDDQPDQWGGTWQITLPQAQSDTVSVSLYTALDTSGVSARILSNTDSLTPGQDTELIVQLLKNGQPLRDAVLISGMRANLNSGGNLTLDRSTSDPSQFSGNIPADSIAQTGNVEITLALTLKGQAGVAVPPSLELSDPALSLSFSSGFSFGAPEEPPNDISWDGYCYTSPTQPNAGQVTVKLPFSIGASDLDIESVGSYARVEVYYGQPATDSTQPTATPIAVLAFDRESGNAFRGKIPCSLLLPGNSQQMLIRAIFPDGKVKDSTMGFDLSAPMPAPEPSPNTPTPIPPTPTLTPPAPNVIDDAVKTVTTPPVSTVAAISVGAMLAGFVFWGGTSALAIARPLRSVKVYQDDLEEALPLGLRSQEFKLQDETVFKLKALQDGRTLIVTPKVEGARINGNPMNRDFEYPRDERRFVVQYQNTRWTVINRRSQDS